MDLGLLLSGAGLALLIVGGGLVVWLVTYVRIFFGGGLAAPLVASAAVAFSGLRLFILALVTPYRNLNVEPQEHDYYLGGVYGDGVIGVIFLGAALVGLGFILTTIAYFTAVFRNDRPDG